MSSPPTLAPAPHLFAVETLVPGFEPPPRPTGPRDAAAMDAADAAARYWRSPSTGKLRPGSVEHAQALRAMFRETFNPYRPSVIAWPKLSDEARDRITSLPIWDIAVQTEGRARMFMAAYAATLEDPAMRDALALNAWEESRHKEVLSRLVEAYGIPLVAEPPYSRPADPEWAYLVTGYSECVDSFFAFGLFALAHRSGLFPPELVETFEPVMQEECRHILLFANWAAWHRRRLSILGRIRFELKVARVYLFLLRERIGLARSLEGEGDKTKSDSHFAVTGARSVTEQDFTLRELLELCLAENDRRFAGYDPRLLRPRTMSTLVRLVLPLIPKPKTRPRTTVADRKQARIIGVIACSVAAGVVANYARADEVFVGGYGHDVTSFISSKGVERGQDIEVGYQTAPVEGLRAIGRPMLYSEYVGNDARRTSYGSAGFRWRRDLIPGRFYGQIGLGLALRDGVDKYQNPNAPGLTEAQTDERLYIERNLKDLGSHVLFQPNAALGWRLSSRWAVEAVWNHISNAGIFAHINPGMDDFGGRLVYRFGPTRR